ncbi:hypothetical protein OO014_10865 [Intrasporangium calvum]|uniref:Secreted protein n=1 Tax=Intrasporangium calvum TaxID=53358 RepID=A0ABT5GHP0_9MICO|nr:hypothetical protein [Intrasporangium calvum]MDC5697763.1 hypothetical protein [Intrasporangium calvum]
MPHERLGLVMDESGVTSHPPRRRRRGRIALLLVVALVAGGGWLASRFLYDSLRTPRCTITAAGMTESFDPEQTGNAALITALSIKRDLPPRAATIALTTAYQESKILNITYGDRDSLGLFQQRPSQGWGTKEQILDPVYSTNKFYDALLKVEDYEHADITEIAQKVQRSGYPEAYRDHEGQGRVLASALSGHSPAGLTCRLAEATGAAKPAAVAKALATEMGVKQAEATGDVLTVTAPDQQTAWAVAHWSVARAAQFGATRVTIGERAWDREAGDDGWSEGAASTTVTVTLG